MGNSGQPGGFCGGNAEKIDFPLRQNTGTGCDLMEMLFGMSETSESPQNPTTGQFNNQQNGFPVAPGSDKTNMNVQITGTIDCQQHGQQIARSHQISSSGQPSSDQTNTNVQRTGGTPKMSPEQAEKKRKIDKAYREKKRKEKIETESKLKELDDENKKLKNKIADLEGANADLERANASMIENLQSKTEMIDKLKSDLDELKQESEKENAIQRKLLKMTDFKKFINEGSKHYKEPTRDSFSSYEERFLEEEIFAGTKHAALEGDDSGDENGDSKRKKKQAAPSATNERCSGKVPKVKGMYDELMETRQVTLAAKKLCYDARADQREGSTSNPTAMVIDPYSITECLRILQSMRGIPYSIVKKAKAKFESPDEREYFVGLIDEDWRRGWVKDLEDS